MKEEIEKEEGSRSQMIPRVKIIKERKRWPGKERIEDVSGVKELQSAEHRDFTL